MDIYKLMANRAILESMVLLSQSLEAPNFKAHIKFMLDGTNALIDLHINKKQMENNNVVSMSKYRAAKAK